MSLLLRASAFLAAVSGFVHVPSFGKPELQQLNKKISFFKDKNLHLLCGVHLSIMHH